MRWKVESTFEVVKIPNLFCAKFTRAFLNLCHHKNGWKLSQSTGLLWRQRNENRMEKFGPNISINLISAKFTRALLNLCQKYWLMLSQYRGRAMKKSGNLWDEQLWAWNILNFHFVGRKIPALIQNTLFKTLPKRGHAKKVNFGQRNWSQNI